MKLNNNNIYNVDCLDGMKLLPEQSINMIITSPPYAEQRKKTYGGIPEDKYIEWFIPLVKEMERILKKDGSFFLNIKEHTKDGFRSTYVMELVLEIIKQTNFKLVDTIAWTKIGYPGKFNNRFKNAWEPIYHFSLDKNIKFFPLEVGEPLKNPQWYKRKREKDITQNGSGFSRPDYRDMENIQIARPSNHIHIKNVVNQFTENRWHSATYPVELTDFFIKALSEENDIILDPFMGSGTTAISALKNNRNYIGYELSSEYFLLLEDRILNFKAKNSIL
jgi:site-specific DNA-methyltransferase (adenine-specific)/site-specific DNA-methyltransferase (cytosine-N4-specific)